MNDTNELLAVAPSGTAPASSPVEPGGADMLLILLLSHSAHASNGAKIAEPEFGTPVSLALPLEADTSYSSAYTP
jgi:hypothetical protein